MSDPVSSAFLAPEITGLALGSTAATGTGLTLGTAGTGAALGAAAPGLSAGLAGAGMYGAGSAAVPGMTGAVLGSTGLSALPSMSMALADPIAVAAAPSSFAVPFTLSDLGTKSAMGLKSLNKVSPAMSMMGGQQPQARPAQAHPIYSGQSAPITPDVKPAQGNSMTKMLLARRGLLG